MSLELKPKQQSVVDIINDCPEVDTIYLIGAVGTGKTDIAASIGIDICDTFEKTYWTVFRKNISTAKRSVIPSYLTMLDRKNFKEGEDYTYNGQDYEIKFPNGSKIGFVEADETKDRNGQKIKGINASASHIDEADELSLTMFTTARSRKGRRNTNGQPSIAIITLNPNDVDHIKEVYMRWKYSGNGKYEPLPPNIRVVEFDLSDSWQIQSDIDAMMTNPTWWVERYLKNNWEYQDESKTIFRSSIFAKAVVKSYKPGRKTTGYDVARDGVDRSVAVDWENLTLVDGTITKDSNEQIETGKQAEWLIEHSDNFSIGYENIAVDGVGVGVGVIDGGKDRGAEFAVFKSGFSPDPFLTFGDEPKSREDAERSQELMAFNNLRSQVAYMLAMGLDSGKVKILDSFPFLNEFIKEAQMHHHEYKDKVFVLESKESIKKRLGKSPDIFDSVLMGFWLQLRHEVVMEWAGIM
jgi:hypothetical protein